MAEMKTKQTAASVTAFIDGIEDEDRRRDCREVMKIMQQATGQPPRTSGLMVQKGISSSKSSKFFGWAGALSDLGADCCPPP